jgi:hypothetical protein
MSLSRSAAVLAVSATTVAVLLSGSAAAPPSSGSAAPTQPDPKLFKNPGSNPYYPLTPGLTTYLHGTDDGEHFKQRVRVTHRTKLIAGVTCTVVHDVLRRLDGSLAEKTDDWYATDNAGNVWYFGEDTGTYDKHGHLQDKEGSWEAGVHGAVAGIIMPADPHPSTAARQEYKKGVAEDQGWVVQRLASVGTPGGPQHHVVRTLEWSRLEPYVVSMKFYARGLGIVMEKDLSGGTERFWLVHSTPAVG